MNPFLINGKLYLLTRHTQLSCVDLKNAFWFPSKPTSTNNYAKKVVQEFNCLVILINKNKFLIDIAWGCLLLVGNVLCSIFCGTKWWQLNFLMISRLSCGVLLGLKVLSRFSVTFKNIFPTCRDEFLNRNLKKLTEMNSLDFHSSLVLLPVSFQN